MIARTLGARVYRNAIKEIGWFDIQLTQAGAADPVFNGLNPKETVFHWHSDTFDLPAGTVLLARSDRTERQAFKYGKAVYALQFHLEVTDQMIVNWCRQDENCGDARELRAQPDPRANRNRLNHIAQLVFEQWCDLLPRTR